MPKKLKISTKDELRRMLERIRHENEALQRFIDALKEQNKEIDKEILNKSNK
jgi:hypothetical protein